MSRYSRWAQREYGFRPRIVATLLAGIIFVFLIPLGIVVLGPTLDRVLGLRRFEFGAANVLLGGSLAVVGFTFALWSILAQLEYGRGTPLPMMPTQQLLTRGPFRYCRNPMTFGTILAYLGIGIIVGTISGTGLVLLFALLLVLYLKRFEESELAERFGNAYLAYKQEVPFIVPRPPQRHKGR